MNVVFFALLFNGAFWCSVACILTFADDEEFNNRFSRIASLIATSLCVLNIYGLCNLWPLLP